MCCLPLWTAMVSPTKSGVIVERREHVLIGRLSDVARAASTLDCKWWSTNGPFLIERAILVPLTLLRGVAAADDHAVGTFVAPCLIALGRRPPGGPRMAAAVGTAAMRVIHRIHGNAANGWADAAPPLRAGLADRTQVVLFVADGANRRPAVDVHLANLARVHAQLRIGAFAREQLHRRSGGTRHLRAFARQHLDTMYGRAHRNVAQRQAIAGLDRRLGPAHQLRAGRDASRSNDVAPLAIAVEQQCEMCAAVRVVFEPFHLGRNTILVAAKIDDAVMLLVAAALVAHGDMAIVVAPRTALLRLDQRLDRPTLVQVRIDDLDQRATAGRGRFHFDKCHDQASCAKLISWPGIRLTYAFFQLRRRPL